MAATSQEQPVGRYLPPCTPELHPAETLWVHIDEPVVNRHVETSEKLDTIIASQFNAFIQNKAAMQSQTRFHWWPKTTNPT